MEQPDVSSALLAAWRPGCEGIGCLALTLVLMLIRPRWQRDLGHHFGLGVAVGPAVAVVGVERWIRALAGLALVPQKTGWGGAALITTAIPFRLPPPGRFRRGAIPRRHGPQQCASTAEVPLGTALRLRFRAQVGRGLLRAC